MFSLYPLSAALELKAKSQLAFSWGKITLFFRYMQVFEHFYKKKQYFGTPRKRVPSEIGGGNSEK